jgi:HAD superfamily 5'-nucleotidase-like hydrolase
MIKTKSIFKTLPRFPSIFRRNLNHEIFVNNAVDLSSTKVFGFDYDYTLAEYRPATMNFIFNKAKEFLVEKYGFPSEIRDLPYDTDFIIRGLFYDPKRSVMMKLDSYSVIDANAVFKGLERIPESELAELYSTRRMGVHRLDQNYRGVGKNGFYQVLDEFSIPEAYLFSAVTQYFIDKGLRYEPFLMYRMIRNAVGDVHISQSLYKEVASNRTKYLGEQDSMRSLISHLSNHKKLFIISNSPFWFINMGMQHIVAPDWRDAFEIVICEAGKPDFFLEKNRPFLEMTKISNSTSSAELTDKTRNFLNLNTAKENHKMRYEKKENWKKVQKFEKGKIYFEGCLEEFGRLTDWDQKSVLYFGDQINADLAEPSLRFGWRTAAVIPELRNEIEIFNSSDFKHQVQLLHAIEKEYDILANAENNYQQRCSQLLRERTEIKKILKKSFPSPFGSTFRTDLTKSHYARQLERYAELYTSSVKNFDGLCLERKYFPPRTTLVYDAHHMDDDIHA